MAKEQKKEDSFEQLEEALTQGEQFIEKNQKKLLNGLIAVIVIVGGFFLYQSFIKQPKVEKAKNAIFGAQKYFDQDSFNLAINGDGNVMGFAEIADKYSSTPSGNIANLYCGISYLHIGKYEEAIQYLKSFSSDDAYLSNMALANIGDAYMQLKEYTEAATYYSQAAASNANDFSTPIFLMKNGLALEKSNNYDAALKVYERIEKEFPNSPENRDIEKYITRVKLNLNK